MALLNPRRTQRSPNLRGLSCKANKISRKSVPRETGFFFKHAEGLTDMKKLMVSFRNFANDANVPKKVVSVPPYVTGNTADLNNTNHQSVTLTFLVRV
jgi:hypothetical protein